MAGCAHSVAAPAARSCARAVTARHGSSFPAALALLWSSAKPFRSLKGAPPVYTDTPTLSAGGVVPGDGPSFTDPVDYSAGGTRVKEFTMTTASADIVGTVAMGSGFFVTSAGILFSDGTNATPVLATGWDVGDVVTVVVHVVDGVMRVGVME